nr:DUF5004 domain-containing protein [uncultured Carboxylicivirga sp.]
MKILLKTRMIIISTLLIFSAISCDLFEEDEMIYTESNKNITGTWQIAEAYRNDVNITDMMDFTKFQIRFNQDETYTMTNYLPFVVKKEGNYSLDDPKYPFHIVFLQSGEGSELKSALSYSVVDAERQIGLTFSPGCGSNSYTYILTKVSEN